MLHVNRADTKAEAETKYKTETETEAEAEAGELFRHPLFHPSVLLCGLKKNQFSKAQHHAPAVLLAAY